MTVATAGRRAESFWPGATRVSSRLQGCIFQFGEFELPRVSRLNDPAFAFVLL